MTTTTADNEHSNRSDSNADSHSDSHGGRQRPSYDDVNVPVVFLVGVISMILTFVTIWFVEGVYYKWKNGMVNERTYEVTNTVQGETIKNQKAMLEGNQEKGITSFESVIDGVVGKYDNSSASGTHDESAHSEEEHPEGH